MLSTNETAAVIIEPYFDAVRDTFIDFSPEPGIRLDKLRGTRFVVSDKVHDTPRHYAMCREDGLLIMFAPEVTKLSWKRVVAIATHEMGHAADFLYPGQWVPPARSCGEAIWVGRRNDKAARRWRGLWHERTDDQIEWTADSIAKTVTGKTIKYCGPCMVQCFSGGRLRPAGLS